MICIYFWDIYMFFWLNKGWMTSWRNNKTKINIQFIFDELNYIDDQEINRQYYNLCLKFYEIKIYKYNKNFFLNNKELIKFSYIM